MRAIFPAIRLILAFSVATEESKPTLADTLEREKRGEFDNTALDAPDQIDAAGICSAATTKTVTMSMNARPSEV